MSGGGALSSSKEVSSTSPCFAMNLKDEPGKCSMGQHIVVFGFNSFGWQGTSFGFELFPMQRSLLDTLQQTASSMHETLHISAEVFPQFWVRYFLIWKKDTRP